MDIVATDLAICGLRWASANYLLRVGKITAEQLTELGAKGVVKIAIPRWMRFGGAAIAVVAISVAVDLIIDSIDGAVQRKELRDAIHEVTKTRLNTKITDMYNRNLLSTLNAVIASYNAIKNLSLPPAVLDEILKNLVDQNKIGEKMIHRNMAIDVLTAFDKTRNSWTNEDGDWAFKDLERKRLRAIPLLSSSVKALKAIEALESINEYQKLQVIQNIEMNVL